MEKYIGTKIVQAVPAYKLVFRKSDGPDMVVTVSEEHLDSNIEAAAKRGMSLISKLEGYEVVYEDGYKSWSPKEVFEKAYRRTDGMSFGLAIEAAKMGKKIARAGWNSKNQYVELGRDFAYHADDGNNHAVYHLDIESAALVFVGTRGRQVGWLASQADMLADDWMIVE